MPFNKRTLRDLNLTVSKALPAAGAANLSASIDTTNVNPGRVAGGNVVGSFELLIELPATPALVDTKTIILKLQDSADNITFTDNVDVPAQTLTGAGGVGAAALAYQFKAPITMKRYILLSQAVLAAGGDSTALSGVLSLIF
jgi:hypothetical protein